MVGSYVEDQDILHKPGPVLSDTEIYWVNL